MLWIPAILILPYIILLLEIYRSLLQNKTFYVSDDPVTFVSVIVACRNEQGNLQALLKSIVLQNYPEILFEVIIVNDKSTDNTFEIAAGFKGIRNILTLNNAGNGKKQALRTGIIAARGNLIITTDADCRMGKNWVRTIASFYEKNRPDMIICPVQLESVSGFFGRFQELEFMSLQGITEGTANSGKATMCNGANLAFTREVFLSHSDNLYDEINSGDDIFLLQSLKKEKQPKILWLESYEAQVTTKQSSTFRSFFRQRIRWISKSKVYDDKYTTILGTVTFITIILQTSYLIAGIIYPPLILVFLSVLILKSVPDFLILHNTTQRSGKRNLMRWFLPVQVIYPFYILSVVACSLISTDIRNINSPFPKGT